MGNFAEGFCFKVNAAGGEEETWIICVDSLKLKEEWMK